MALILFVAELGSGFGHVRRLLPIARAAVAAGHHARFLVGNPTEVAECVGRAGFELAAAPRVRRLARHMPATDAVATSFGDILGGSGFADPDFLRAVCAAWDAELAALQPAAVVSELSPLLNLACFGGKIPLLSVGHGFVLPPPHLAHFPALLAGTPIYSEPCLMEHVTAICRARGRTPPPALPALLGGSAHAVTGLDVLDPYRLERRQPTVGPPELARDLDAQTPSDEVFVYLLGEAPVTLTVLRGLGASRLRGYAFVRRGNVAQREALAGSGIVWLEQPDEGRRALSRTRLVIHHGSMLTAEEALFLGRPQVVVPIYLEHLLTARALSALGLAAVMRPPHDADEIAHKISLSHADFAMWEAARAFADNLQLNGIPAHELAATLVASVVRSSTTAPCKQESELEVEAPVVSFVVPSYQMAAYLALSLQSLAMAQRGSSSKFEIVVVDDGSTDETREVFDAAATRAPDLPLRYVHRLRDERSCRSLARNVGAAASRGRYLVFLDAGVMVHPELLTLLLRRWTGTPGASEDVLTIGTLGLFASQFYTDTSEFHSRFHSTSPEELAAHIETLSAMPAWCDRRQSWFDFTGGELSKLPAPWLLAWSCALGVPRRLFEATQGFDETFLTWGAEDCDFALRLHEAGARFHAFAAPAALHVPHPTEGAASKKAQNQENARRMHAKRFGWASELFLVFEDPFAANMLAMRLDRCSLEQMLPHWHAESSKVLQRVVGACDGALVVGAPTPQLVAQLEHVTWAVPSRPLFESLGRALGANAVKLTMGCHCDELAKGRESVILTDLFRILPPQVQRAQLQEAFRVGRKVYFASAERAGGMRDASALHREREGWSWSSLDGLSTLVATVGITLAEVTAPVSSLRVFALTALPAPK